MNSQRTFTHTAMPMRVVFGTGSLNEIDTELDRLALGRVMIISTPQQASMAQDIAKRIGNRAHTVYPHAAMHVPGEISDAAVAYAREHHIDGCVAIGGGSAIGLGKIIALEAGLVTVAVPTTYAGSEMTPIWGKTQGADKKTGRDLKVLPHSVIYDASLTLTLPSRQSVTSGLNALAHAAEALYAPDSTPIIDLMAGEAARALCASLPKIVHDPSDQEARNDALYGAWLAGTCLGSTTMSLHHKLCHILGGTFNLPHAETHAAVLPYVLAYNLPAAPNAQRILTSSIGADDPAPAILELARELGVAATLEELGMPRSGIETVVEKASSSPYANPREASPDDIRGVVTCAFDGILLT